MSALLSTSGLHYSRWQSGEICQVLFTGAYLMQKIRGESHFLVISHWTSYATKNDLVSEEEARYMLMSQTCQARLGTTERVREGSMAVDDSQLPEVARQVVT